MALGHKIIYNKLTSQQFNSKELYGVVSGSSVATAYRDKLGLPFGNGYTQAGMREDLLCSLLGKDHGGGHSQSRGGQSLCRSECLSTPGEGSFETAIGIKYNDDWVFVLQGDFLGVEHHWAV